MLELTFVQKIPWVCDSKTVDELDMKTKNWDASTVRVIVIGGEKERWRFIKIS